MTTVLMIFDNDGERVCEAGYHAPPEMLKEMLGDQFGPIRTFPDTVAVWAKPEADIADLMERARSIIEPEVPLAGAFHVYFSVPMLLEHWGDVGHAGILEALKQSTREG